MFIANLMASVLALAMVGASTASISKFENNAVRSVENTSFVASPKKAYYDPTETYGTTGQTCYNYSQTAFKISSNSGTAGKLELTTGQSSIPAFHSIMGVNQAFYIYAVDSSATAEFFEQFDIYIGGELAEENELVIGGGPQSGGVTCEVIPRPYITSQSNFPYVWVFDHGTPLEPYTPVDILGDIAEGLTGGIVPVAEGIGSGLQSLVQDIFLNAAHDGLSVFGIVIICFAGLALALGVSRWVLNFVDTLGARDR